MSQAEPTQFAAGDRLQWQRVLSDYPAGVWALKYYLVNAAGKIEITATGSGTTYTVDVLPATSAAYAPGTYAWQAYAVAGTADRKLVDSGTIKILPDFAASSTTNYDARPFAQQALDAVESILKGTATFSHKKYKIGDRELEKYSIGELMKLRNQLREELKGIALAEKIANGCGNAGRITMRLR